jgi:hypothetical protein
MSGRGVFASLRVSLDSPTPYTDATKVGGVFAADVDSGLSYLVLNTYTDATAAWSL